MELTVQEKEYLEKAFALENYMKDLPEEEQLDLEPIHYFTDGMYLRSLFIPQGVTCVGEIHRYSHFTILAEGKSTIVSQDGKLEVEAPYVFISKPNAKRCVYANTDCTWMTVHVNTNNNMNIKEVEDTHVIRDPQELLEILE